MAGSEETFLQKLTRAFAALEAQSSVSTRDFTDAIETMFPVFDHLGIVLSYAAYFHSAQALSTRLSWSTVLRQRTAQKHETFHS